MLARLLFAAFLAGGVLAAQNGALDPAAPGPSKADTSATPGYTVDAGTKVPLSLINSISTRHSVAGDRVYLETSFPILAGGRIVIPVGSYVAGTVTEIRKPGRMKGRGELYVRFDSLTLPNGVTRDFRARIGGMDGTTASELDKAEGKVRSEGNKAGDARTVGEAAGAGASIGVIAGNVAGHTGMGVGIGAAAGAAAGLIGVLVSRGPDAVLPRGSTVEMVLDRKLTFSDKDLDFSATPPARSAPAAAAAPAEDKKTGGPLPRRHLPW